MDFTDMDIVVGSAASVKNEVSDSIGAGPYYGRQNNAPKDRRRNKRDRRKSVREGIFVSLSTENDRRVMRDRRRAN